MPSLEVSGLELFSIKQCIYQLKNVKQIRDRLLSVINNC